MEAAASTSGDLRPNGRLPNQVRAATCRVGVLLRADGSAQWEQDQTVILAAVHGPLAAAGKKEHPSEAVIDVVFKPFAGVPGVRERHLERQLAGVLRALVQTALHPRTVIQVVLQVVHEDGSVLAAALNAAVAALLDAAVPLHALLSAACVAISEDGVLCVDPDAQEEAVARCRGAVGFHVRRPLEENGARDAEIGELAICDTAGLFAPQELHMMIETAKLVALHTVQLQYMTVAVKAQPV